MSLHELFEAQEEDAELVPRPHNVEVRLHIEGSVTDFFAVFTRVAAILPSREVIPGTQFARLRAGRATAKTSAFVEVAGSDGERTARTVTDRLAVYVEGQVLVPAQRIVQILRKAPQNQVVLEVQGTLLTIRSGQALWSVALPKGEDLTVAAKAWAYKLYPIVREPFLVGLRAVSPATGDPNGRPSMAQVKVKNSTLLACDGLRVHRIEVPALPSTLEFSIPSSAIGQVLQMLQSSRAETFELGCSERLVEFEVDSTKVTLQQLAAPFPGSVESIITTAAVANTDRIVVDTLALREAVERVRVNADPDRAQVTLTLLRATKRDGHDLVVHARDSQGNAAQEVVPCQWFGPERKVVLTLHKVHLTDLLSLYTQSSIPLHIGAEGVTKAGAVYAEDGETGLVVVLQQMRLGR